MPEEARRQQLIEVTIDSLAEVGYVGSTLAQIAQRAGVSPGLVAHYFGDKDGLLEATFRTLARRIGERMRERLRLARTPRGARAGGDRRQPRAGGIRSAHRARRGSPSGDRCCT